jgi:hypothetical protein
MQNGGSGGDGGGGGKRERKRKGENAKRRNKKEIAKNVEIHLFSSHQGNPALVSTQPRSCTFTNKKYKTWDNTLFKHLVTNKKYKTWGNKETKRHNRVPGAFLVSLQHGCSALSACLVRRNICTAIGCMHQHLDIVLKFKANRAFLAAATAT